jgi:anti-sigma factor (TIGR02949 family)
MAKETAVMICDDVKRVAYFFLDGSMGEKKQTDFKTHVSLCPECEQRVSIHRRLRNFISRRLGRQAAPPTLRQRLTRTFRALRSDA